MYLATQEYRPIVQDTIIHHPEGVDLIQIGRDQIDSFVIFIAYEGAALLRDAQGAEVSLKAGEAVLFPASNTSVTIEPQTPRFACLDTYCK